MCGSIPAGTVLIFISRYSPDIYIKTVPANALGVFLTIDAGIRYMNLRFTYLLTSRFNSSNKAVQYLSIASQEFGAMHENA